MKRKKPIHKPSAFRTRSRTRAKGIAAAMRRMSVGDSFLAPAGVQANTLYITSHRLGISIELKRDGKRTRVWRVIPKRDLVNARENQK